ncbi:18110_t:CDS:2 [Cetraspora pellucida]|uniref:18110_t:CDS:1 n=1 Tax=Cetraspora pellucida TaxID=1433469 RepID=A0ACA9K0H1_9GLOM|nr:18110_t:CDS:2 [Cetraspora pellucida]
MGLLIDSEKASFTLDPIIQKQVREAFIKLYREGLIYRGQRLVNWDPKLRSVISDIEVEHKPSKSKLYYLKYPLQKSDEYLLVATSRPETIFADVALFVNPNDHRYQKYLNQSVKHPFTEKNIPILADENIRTDFGTGVLKCTPSHDFTDYDLGKKYQLPIINCCDEKGILNELAGPWQGQEISIIREKLVKELEKKGICVKIEEYEANLACSTKSGRSEKTKLGNGVFLDNYGGDTKFRLDIIKKRGKFMWVRNLINVREPEKDVLDTWFSSGLWPLIALAKEGKKFPSPPPNCYPITTLITVPFKQVLLHGLIRDKYGKKMSKSLGNGVEPDELIEKYGCDSLRLFLLENNIWGSDLIYEEICQKEVKNSITLKNGKQFYSEYCPEHGCRVCEYSQLKGQYQDPPKNFKTNFGEEVCSLECKNEAEKEQ